ncbi:hypothetical protein C9I92_21690 [Photobacterium ganghwense]|uniref:Uncharacterized protein n=1 Tax=Photobacterium ganghwense TaxID=320778 RepID=A0A0J1HEW2_9GAMM|nr:hypothetical protein [Photobacterium ganghwense]KLV10158.1 hypothetical protein ABT57_06145 [Photobacterium ganghwense]PSU05405.1 hypothetical protein C9I92_21690 [Photobacterium ganghwense]
MFAKHRAYVLAKKKRPKAQVTINPTGNIHIDVKDEKKALDGDFEDLSFQKNGKVTILVCQKHSKQKQHCWRIELSDEDAKELTRLINEAEDEFEILMRDL